MNKRNNTYKEMLRVRDHLSAAVRPAYDDFDSYVLAHPEGEHFRRWVTGDGRLRCTLVPCYPEQTGLPGDYYFANIAPDYGRVNDDKRWSFLGTYHVHVNDCDDSGANKRGLTMPQAEQELQQLKLMAPFMIRELRDFGYEVY